MKYDALLQQSRNLGYEIPTTANRLTLLSDRGDEIEEHAAGARPILHGKVAGLIRDFLHLKREQGSPIERALYAGMHEVDFVSRLLSRRPLAFLNATDSYLLRDGSRGDGGFEAIGTADEREPLTLRDLLSYDEMAISALLGVSVPTPFINSGARTNRGIPGDVGTFEPQGIYVGLVGTRFERMERMEWRHMLVTPGQNTVEKGYGARANPEHPQTRLLQTWARFYGLAHFPLFSEAAEDTSGRFLALWDSSLFDTDIYRKRLKVTVEAFLRDADDRAREAGKSAYLHVVGLGLGVWRVDARQTDLMIDVYAEILRERCFPHIADLNFSWFRAADSCGGVPDGDVFSGGGNTLRVHFSQRDPAAPLRGVDAGKLLVAMYAWDSNAFPGNEYWLGALSASGDPAAACCSCIPELQNPDVNPHISGEHAMVFPERGEDPVPLTAG